MSAAATIILLNNISRRGYGSYGDPEGSWWLILLISLLLIIGVIIGIYMLSQIS